ncbi:MAG TPA: chlorite dismutase family protein [Gemmatimonadales bacterium]|nr:chlorite dismutase family protein [Gemmatimonadales bacterium]
MAEQTPETLNHFAVVSFSQLYAQLPTAERHARLRSWLDRLRAAAEAVHCYQLSGFESDGELMVWSACSSAEPERVGRFFADWAVAKASVRDLVEIRQVLWGFTRPSPYTRTRSVQEVDPFGSARRPFMIVYPFVKTPDWYQLDRETRQQMMASHIRVGTQYKEITQLLLYSFGLQDQEFVVVYETDDPRRFLSLVQELRSTEARIYTLRDAPLHTGQLLADMEAIPAWL